MALRQSGSNLHVLARAAGLTGLLILGAGLVVLLNASAVVGICLAAAGAVFLVPAAVVESLWLTRAVSSRRAALGSNVFLQIALAVVLLVGVNAFSFYHHLRLDWTRGGIFTIDPAIQRQLAGLRGETRIVLFQRQKSFGQLADKPDNYDAAAERRIVEKVKDLVEQFQELGPRFRVEVLDIQDENYQEKLAAIKNEAPALGKAIEAAPENSIFFFNETQAVSALPAGEVAKVQRLGFHDIYQLDKQASQQADDGRGNLVLRYQGIQPFANRILNIDEKKPRVAVAVVHELLGLDNTEELGMAGAKKVFAARGFGSKDIILKKWGADMPEPAVLTYDESKAERLDDEIAEADEDIKVRKKEVEVFDQLLKEWKTQSIAELRKSALAKRIDEPVTEEVRQQVIKRFLEPNKAIRQMALDQMTKERDAAEKERKGLNVENLSEQRRISDLRSKFNRMLADADLLIVPRMTLVNVTRGEAIPNWVHGLDPDQLSAVKDFMKAGKPVLFCIGPVNESPGRPSPPGVAPDQLESLLGNLGIQMPHQTILFDVESKSFGERRAGFLVLGTQSEVPPVEFEWKPGAGEVVRAFTKKPGEQSSNPVRTSLRLAASSVGKDLALDLRLRNPRPIYYDPPDAEGKSEDAVFMMTDVHAWNEKQPFPTRERVPHFELPKPGDPDVGTQKEERHGQFPIAVAVETRLPASWSEGKGGLPAKVRLAVIGHGGVFSGPSLAPAKEKLLLDVSNWLLGRDDLLAKGDREWRYPRVALADSDFALWVWGTHIGMPVFFVALGLIVLMVRRMR